MKLPSRLVWVDLETTGLDPVKDQILEVAIVITDNRMTEVANANWIVTPNGLVCDRFIVGMHNKNGLFADLVHGQALADVDVMGAGMVRVTGAAGGPICGSTPHFDLSFLRVHMPLLARCFNYRVFDVSTLKLADLINRDGREVVEAEPKHRALADIRYSIQCAKEFLGLEEVT